MKGGKGEGREKGGGRTKRAKGTKRKQLRKRIRRILLDGKKKEKREKKKLLLFPSPLPSRLIHVDSEWVTVETPAYTCDVGGEISGC